MRTMVALALVVLFSVVPSLTAQQPGLQFSLGSVVAQPGTVAKVPLYVRSDVSVVAVFYSLDFDEEVLEVLPPEPVFELSPKPASAFGYTLDNHNTVPGNGGLDEGFVNGTVIVDLHNRKSLPPGEDVHLLNLIFRVNETASETSTELRLLNGPPGSEFQNEAGAIGTPAELVGASVLIPAQLKISREVFIRGDTNGDEAVELSDAVATLQYLFMGTAAPACFDAADANDDGVLSMSDAVRTLQFLFLGGPSLPEPTSAPGVDPTTDMLSCSPATD